FISMSVFCQLYSPILFLRSSPTRRSSDLVAIGWSDGFLDVARRRRESEHAGDAAAPLRHQGRNGHAALLIGMDEALAIERDRGVDRKSTRLNSSHVKISYAVFCLKKK